MQYTKNHPSNQPPPPVPQGLEIRDKRVDRASRALPVCRLGTSRCTRVRVADLQRWVDRHTSRVSAAQDEE